jgi:hypothetical protein
MRHVEEMISEAQKQKRQLKFNEADLIPIKAKKDRIAHLLTKTNQTIPTNLYAEERILKDWESATQLSEEAAS